MGDVCRSDLSERCDALESVLQPECNARRGGITLVVLTNLQTWTNRVAGVAARLTMQHSPVYFQVCPFCRTELTGQPSATTEAVEATDG